MAKASKRKEIELSLDRAPRLLSPPLAGAVTCIYQTLMSLLERRLARYS
jgi:hypothetical protein